METLPEVPTRWQVEGLRSPPAYYRRLARILDGPVTEHDADVIRLRDGLTRADPVADAFVAWAAGQPPGVARAVFGKAVDEGLSALSDPPEPLVRWLEPLEKEPAWLDREAMRLASRVAWRVGPAGGAVLSAMALMGGYRSSAAVKPLAMTGALDKMVVRRIAETARFVQDTYDSETTSRFSPGFRSACRVRLMHAMVRRSLAARADWDTGAWGVPINQTDTSATHLEFSAIYLSGLTMMGFRFTPEEREAIMHKWRYVAVLMGADDALLAPDFKAGLRHMYIHAVTNPHADADSRALAKALHELPMRSARTPLERAQARVQTRLFTAFSRLTLGDEAVDDIGLPPAPWHPLLLVLSAGRFGAETARRIIPGATERAVRRGRALQREITNQLVGSEKVRYVPYAQRRPKTAAPLAAAAALG